MGFYSRFKLRKGERHPSLRPRRRLLRLLAVAAIVVTTAVVVMYLWRVPVRDDLMKRLLTFAADQGVAVEYAEVWGDLFGRIHFTDVSVFQDADHYVQADKLELSYRLLPLLLEQRLEVANIDITRPYAKWLLPDSVPEKPEPFDPEFSLDLYRLSISDGRVELADTLVIDELDLNVKIKIRPHHLEGVLRSATMQLGLADEHQLEIKRARSEFSYTAPDIIHLDGFQLATPQSLLEGNLHLEGPSWDINLKKVRLDLSELDPGNLAGRITARGRVSEDADGYGGGFTFSLEGFQSGEVSLADIKLAVEGDSGNFDITLDAADSELGILRTRGEIEVGKEVISGAIRIDEVELYQASGFPARLSGELTFDYSIEEKNAGLGLSISHIEFYPTPDCPVSFIGDITGNYLVEEKAGETRGTLSELEIGNMDWGTCRFDLSFDGRGVHLREMVLKDELSRIMASGEWSQDTVKGALDVEAFQMTSLGSLNPLGGPAEVDAKLSIEGHIEEPHLFGVVLVRPQESFFRSATLELIDFDPVSFAGQANLVIADIIVSSRQEFDVSARIDNRHLILDASDREGMALSSQGWVVMNWVEQVYEYECDELMMAVSDDTIMNRNPFIIGYANDSLYLNQLFLQVGDGVVAADGAWYPGDLPDFSMAIYDLDLATVGRMAGLSETTRGKVWGQVASRKRSGDLTLLYELGGSDVFVEGFEADSLSLSGELDRQRLTLDAGLVRGMFLSTASGYVDYDLADTATIQYFDIDVVLHDIGVWPFEFLARLGIIEIKDGVVNGEMNLTGTLERPGVNGWGRITDATIYVPIVDMTADRSYIKLLFSNDVVTFDTIMGYVSSGEREQEGVIRGRGDYNLFTEPNRFFFGFNLRNVLYSPERRIHAIGSGNLYLEGTSNDPLLISGNLKIEEAIIGYELWDEIKVTAPVLVERPSDRPPPQPTYIDLYVSGDRNIWIRNNWMDVEVNANLHVMQEDELYPRIEGVLEAKRGSVYYLDHTLRVDEGRVVFPPTDVLDPELDIWARKTTNQLYPPGSSNAQPIEVILHMGGTLSQPLIEPFSAPPVWSETEVIQYLNLHLAPTGIERPEFEAAFSSALLALAGQFGSRWGRQVIGVDVLTVETIGEGSKITVGKYIGDHWFASYTLNLIDKPDNYDQFTVEYQVGRNQDIVLERDEEGEHSLRYQIKIRY